MTVAANQEYTFLLVEPPVNINAESATVCQTSSPLATESAPKDTP